ncbi:WhiB family transcriptional regulator [Nocardia puris]|uniref:Transcription factor WhiB n=1 Tax=Nocardia puris TaxID=208602 RepID=A0A366CWR7_9NOCA|nr:WhiB family transcriptional regulator [Nocardia puris]RBO82106.1 transcription factor WhiB [Nocardia puris]
MVSVRVAACVECGVEFGPAVRHSGRGRCNACYLRLRRACRGSDAPSDGPWEQRGECLKWEPHLWHPDGRASTEAEKAAKAEQERLAKAICQRCPVLEKCGRAAARTRDEFGIRAGYRLDVPAERRALRRVYGEPTAPKVFQAPTPRECTACGTEFEAVKATRCQLCRRDLVSAAAARAEIERLLAAGWGLTRIAAACGSNTTTLAGIRSGQLVRVRRVTERRILGAAAQLEAVSA